MSYLKEGLRSSGLGALGNLLHSYPTCPGLRCGVQFRPPEWSTRPGVLLGGPDPRYTGSVGPHWTWRGRCRVGLETHHWLLRKSFPSLEQKWKVFRYFFIIKNVAIGSCWMLMKSCEPVQVSCAFEEMTNSVTRLGLFESTCLTNFHTKVAQIFVDFWAILKNITIKQKLLWLHFEQLLETFWQLSFPTSRNTANGPFNLLQSAYFKWC